jgi:outer membrane protein assembly complex protein YaeT
VFLPVFFYFSVPTLLHAKIEAEAAEVDSYEVMFQGNEAISDSELRRAAARELEAFDREGQKRSDIDDAAFQMEIAHRKAGYAFARVDYEIESEEEQKKVTFTIAEGPRVIVRKVTFSGNREIGREELLPFLERYRAGLIRKGEFFFVRSEVEAAVNDMRRYYVTKGYLDVDIEKTRFEFSEERSQVDIAITIREGVQYRIHRVEFRGDVLAEAKDELEKLRREMIGRPYFNRKKLILQTQIAEIYGNSGYPDAVVDVDPQLTPESGHVMLDVSIDSGPLVTIVEIAIRGNERTRANFIRKRIRLKQGDRYDLALQRESFRALYKTGIFSRVNFELKDTEMPGKRTLVVVVEEAPSKELFFEPGWGSYEFLRLRLGFREKNLFGTGRIFGSEATGSLKGQSVLGGLSDLFFLDTDIRADLMAFYNRRLEPSFTREDIGMAFFLTKDVTDNLVITTGYTIRTTDISGVDVEEEEEGEDDNYNFASIKIQPTYDTRNDLFFPTTGQRAFLSVEQVDKVLGSGVNFTRLAGGARLFFRLTHSTVLGLRYSTGLIIPTRDQATVPLAERFFNGGENTVRSFKESELGPKDSSGDPIGGNGFNVLNIELRQRIIGNFIGSVFFDYGNVSPNRSRQEQGKPPYERRSDIISDTLNDFYTDFRPGVGFGFQYLLPVGPARIDFAFNPDRDRERHEDTFVFHFSVGMAF